MNTTYSTYFQTARAVAAYQERSYRNHLRRTRQLTKRIFFSLAATLIAVFIGILTTGFLSRAQASSEPVHYKYFRSIMVYSGDTLSAISSRYIDDHYPGLYRRGLRNESLTGCRRYPRRRLSDHSILQHGFSLNGSVTFFGNHSADTCY